MAEKKCSNCFKVKATSEFYKKKDKHQSRCKACNSEVCFVYQNKNKPEKIEKYFKEAI